MMEKQYLPFTVPDWLKWLSAAILVMLIVLIGYTFYFISGIQKEKESGYPEAAERAVEETNISEVSDVSRYHGDTLYHVISGQTEDGSDAIVYVPEGEDTSIQFFLEDNLIPVDQLLSEWRGACNSCELIDSVLAIDGEEPLLEIKYIDKNNRFVLEYYSLSDGESYERFRLNRSIK